MRIHDEVRYPNVDVETVFSMVTNSTFLARVCAAVRAGEYEVEINPGAGGAVQVMVQRTLPTDTVPEFLSRFVGSTVNVIERTHWGAGDAAGRRQGTVNVSIAGTPVTMTGQTTLVADGNDVVQTVEGNLNAAVPLLGARIEKAIEPAIRGALHLQGREGHRWLTEG